MNKSKDDIDELELSIAHAPERTWLRPVDD